MKFALLDPDADALALVEALLRDGHNELTLFESVDDAAIAHLAALAPFAEPIFEWETVLAGDNDFVLVGIAGPPERRFEQLRRLVLENVAVVFVHPFGLQTLEYHELDMNRQATNTAVVPYAPLRHHTAAGDIAALTDRRALDESSGIGRLQQITIERQAKVRSHATALPHFVRDVGLVLRSVGPCNKVSALGKLGNDTQGDAPDNGGHLGIQITTDDDVLIRWSIGPVVDAAGARATLIGSEGNAILTMPDPSPSAARAPWTLLTRRGDESETITYETGDALPADALAELTAAALTPADDKLWREALADLELVEAVERSMRRGRTVELYHEEASEQGTFHGVMSAVGCLLLMLSIGLAILASMLGWLKLRIANLWPYALLAILVVFLLMQFLKFVFPSEERSQSDE